MIGPNEHMRRFTTTYMQYFKMVYDLPCGDWDFLFRFCMQIVDDEDATSGQFSMSVVGKSMNTLAAHCSPQPVVSMTITNTSRHTYCTIVWRETDRECVYIRHSWLATRSADYLRRVTAELLHPDSAPHRQRGVHARRQGHVCSLDRLITSPCL